MFEARMMLLVAFDAKIAVLEVVPRVLRVLLKYSSKYVAVLDAYTARFDTPVVLLVAFEAKIAMSDDPNTALLVLV